MAKHSTTTVVSINGKITPPRRARISIFDEGLMLGSGQFETLLALANKPIWLREHLRRMEKTRRFFGHPKLYSQKEITQFVTAAVTAHPAKIKAVRLFRTAGAGPRWGGSGGPEDNGSVIVIVTPHQFPDITKGHSANLTPTPLSDGWQSQHKTLSWLAHSYPSAGAKIKRNPTGLDLFHSEQTGITEFASAAVLIRKGTTIYAPPETHILPSVTRIKALEILSRPTSPFKLSIKKINPADISRASSRNQIDEIVALSSTRLAFPIATLQTTRSKPLRYTDFTLTTYLAAAFDRSLKIHSL